ncbi:MAG: TolC family protein [Deltaproteobacteria bacterium]|nr:TolC family protein [Deltaproteobacteria bacterium]
MLHQTLLVTLVLALCVLSGCISSYDPHVTERPMPTELHADAQSESEVEPVEVTVPEAVDAENARAVALAEVVKVAMAEPTSVLEAAARLEAASGRVATSDGRLLPGLSADFRVRYLDGREIGSFGLLQQDVNFARYEPTAAFFYRNNPGAAGTGSKAARRFADAAGYDLKEAQRQAMLQAALSYQDIALTRASMAIATQLVQDARRFYDIANARAVAEIASGADVARAEAALAQAQRAEIQARAFWKAASIRLAQLLRWDLSELLTTDSDQATVVGSPRPRG